MEKFSFEIRQNNKGYYCGWIDIEAKDVESAKKKVNKLTQKQRELFAYDWERGDDTQADGKIEIIDNG